MKWPALVFLTSAALMLVSLMGGVRVLPVHAFGFFDLQIYRESALVVLHGRPLYAAKFQLGDGFTYPPIAALLFLALAAFPLRVDELAVALTNFTLVVVIVRCTLRLGQAQRPEQVVNESGRLDRPSVAWLIAAMALWAEPVTSAMGYGQIDLLIAALVMVDITRGGNSRWAGMGVGAAAALKLTPLIFIPYLAFTGRRRAAARALVAFGLSIAVAYAVLPRDARSYWTGALFDTSRVTGHRRLAGRGPANQSLRGALLRIAPELPHLPAVWLSACVLVAGIGLLLAIRAARRGDGAWGFVLTAVTGLLICPVSWTHHWVMAVPGVLLLLSSPRRSALGRVLIAVLTLGSSVIWIVIVEHPLGANLGVLGLLVGDQYVLAGLGTIIFAGVSELRRLSEFAGQSPADGIRGVGVTRVTGVTGVTGHDVRDIPEPAPGNTF